MVVSRFFRVAVLGAGGMGTALALLLRGSLATSASGRATASMPPSS